MTNQEILTKWNECSSGNLNTFDLSSIYSVMFVDGRNGVDEFLSLFGLTTEELICTDDKHINSSLERIDRLMLDTSHVLRNFIVDYLFSDNLSEEDVIHGYRSSIKDLRDIYQQVKFELKKIKRELEAC